MRGGEVLMKDRTVGKDGRAGKVGRAKAPILQIERLFSHSAGSSFVC